MLRSTLLRTSLVLFAFAQAAVAQEFSADVASLKKESSGLSKIYVSSGKVRLETNQKNGSGGVIIMDSSQQKSVALMPERHMYMDMGQLGMPSEYNFWRPMDPNDACPQWKEAAARFAERSKSAKRELVSCSKVGSESVNGRSTVKYQGTGSDGKTGYVWVDPKLRYIVKLLGEDGNGFELRNIQEGSQPSGLFEVPAGYTKFDMGAAMKQHQ